MSKDFLVVMGLIVGGVIVLMIYTSNLSLDTNSRRVRTGNDVKSLSAAIGNFFSEYGLLPITGPATLLTEGPDGEAFLTIVLGKEPAGASARNPRGIPFLNARVAKIPARGGLVYRDTAQKEPLGLYDGWGRPFHVVYDHDYDNRIADPLAPGAVVHDRQVIVYSLGADGKPGGGDDIKSW